MTHQPPFHILSQPDDTTCGPTCLHAVYDHFGKGLPLDQIIDEVPALLAGGTLGVHLANHALTHGFDATMYTYDLTVFDPTWFTTEGVDLAHKLREQRDAKDDERLAFATEGYLEYLEAGGKILFEDLNCDLLRQSLERGAPILTGLSATYLYRNAREFGVDDDADDVRGRPMGHFVVLCGYDHPTRIVLVADPTQENPLSDERVYGVDIERVIGAILLGVITYDANLVILKPKGT